MGNMCPSVTSKVRYDWKSLEAFQSRTPESHPVLDSFDGNGVSTCLMSNKHSGQKREHWPWRPKPWDDIDSWRSMKIGGCMGTIISMWRIASTQLSLWYCFCGKCELKIRVRCRDMPWPRRKNNKKACRHVVLWCEWEGWWNMLRWGRPKRLRLDPNTLEQGSSEWKSEMVVANFPDSYFMLSHSFWKGWSLKLRNYMEFFQEFLWNPAFFPETKGNTDSSPSQ